MGITIYCDNLPADNKLPTNVNTDICSISVVKWEATLISSIVLIAIGLYISSKYKRRCHKTLLTFHNIRAAVALLLLVINTLELARTFLQWPAGNVAAAATGSHVNGIGIVDGAVVISRHNEEQYSKSGFTGSKSNFIYPAANKESGQHDAYGANKATRSATMANDYVIVVIGIATLWNSFAAILLTIMLMCYHRIVELKKTVEFLYISATLSALVFFLRLYEFAEVVYSEPIYELESCLQGLSAFCLLAICAIDGFTVYKERYRPDYLESYEKIGYKHTLATFYSKICFWWLTPVLWFGYKEPLELEDLGQMRLEDSARAHYDRFLLIYKTAKVKNSNRPPSLWLCYIKDSWRMFTLGGVLKLFGDLFALIGPLAIQQIVQYIETLYGINFANNNNNSSSNNNYNNLNNNSNSISIVARDLRNLNEQSTSNFNKVEHTNSNSSNNQNSYYNNYNKFLGPTNNLQSMAQSIAKLWQTQTSSYVDNYDSNQISSHLHNQQQTHRHEVYGDNYASFDVKIFCTSWCDLLANGWVIAWIVLLAALAQGGLSQASTHILNMTGIRIKTSLQGLIYRKTLLLNSSCLSMHAAGGNADGDEGGDVDANVKPTPVNGSNNPMQQEKQSGGSINNMTDKVDGQQQPADENDLSDIGAITNLMSEDTLNIMSFFWIAHYVWAIPLKIGVVMYLLYLKLGISAVIGSFVCILTMTPLQFLIGKAMSANTEIMAKYTDERLRVLHDTFLGIKLVKLNAWDEVFLKKVRAAREKELKFLNKDSIYWTLMTILTHISTVLITFVTLAFYVLFNADNNELTASHLFSALALFQQLTVPLLIFPITVPIIISAVISTRRLERFLQLREIQKQFEGIRNMARILSKSDASLDMYEIRDIKSHSLDSKLREYDTRKVQKENKQNERLALRINVPNEPAPLAHSEPITPLTISEPVNPFLFQQYQPLRGVAGAVDSNDSLQKLDEVVREKRTSTQRREILRNTPYVVIRPRKLSNTHLLQTRKSDSWHRDSLLLKMPEDMAVSVRDCCFAWNPQKMDCVLSVREVTVPKGKLTIIVGKNGSGKTSLLSALLMEMPLISGDMIWHKTSTIAFVPQQPWLLNASIRDNILFGEPLRPKRYDYVLNACALKPDIELMPAGDMTVIGERGINLSGGQRQRIAIARAVYSSANVVIMDDPLSSLDNEVARHIFEQSIQKMLLMAKRTVIMVTQQLQLVQQADYLIVMKNVSLQASGTYKEIQLKYPHIIAKWNTIIAKATEQEQEDMNALGRTARERWKLFKNVTKLGLQRSVSMQNACKTNDEICGSNANAEAQAGQAANDENEDMVPEHFNMHNALRNTQSFGSFTFTRRRSSVYGSRHLIYDVPLPIDECQNEDVVMRRHRRRSSSRASSRLSGISTTSTADLRRSQLTASCSSGGSYTSNISGAQSYLDEKGMQQKLAREPRVQSWQPQSTICDASKMQHKQVARNISLPENFQQSTSVCDGEARPTDAELVADMVKSTRSDSIGFGNGSGSGSGSGGFQQFLRRMSMRRSNKPTTSVVHRKHRPVSDSNSILSISEESSAMQQQPSLPSIELSSITTDTELETENWVANFANEEASLQDASMDSGISTTLSAMPQATTDTTSNANNHVNTAAECLLQPIIPTTTDSALSITTGEKSTCSVVTGEHSRPEQLKMEAVNGQQTSQTVPITHEDNERKYGKISIQIYLLYLRASRIPIVVVFFISALIWQSLRVYTDVWLQHWTDDSGLNNGVASNRFDMPNEMKSAKISAISRNASHLLPINTSIPASVIDPALQYQQHAAAGSHDVTYYFTIYAAISCVCIIMAMISTPAGQLAGCNARRNLHDKLLLAIMRKTLYFFQITPLGRIMNRFSNDMAIIDKKIAATSQRLLQFSLLCLCAVLINVAITPWFIILTLPICGAYYAIQKFYRCSSRELQRIENSTNSPVISHLSETIQGVTTIRAYNQESRFTEILFRRLEANTIAFTILNTSNRWLGISLDYLGGVIVFVAILTALIAATVSCQQQHEAELNFITSVNSHNNNNSHTHTPSPSLVGLAINYTLLIPIYLNWVVKLLADMEMYIGSVERIAYYADADDDNVDKLNNAKVLANETTAANKEQTMTTVTTAVESEMTVLGIENADDVERVAINGNASDDKLKSHKFVAHATSLTNRAWDTIMPVMERLRNKQATNQQQSQPLINKQYKTVPISWPQRGDITFDNVSLRYEGRNEDVIKQLTLKIPAGQRIGICGRTGSGKSSLALSLFGVLQTTSGRICIDDIDITEIHPDEIRTRLSIIPQDVHLFMATIRENLDPAGYYSDLELWNCLEMAQLKDFVNGHLPQGLDTVIMDGGLNLSTGYRQLLCLARAILRGSVCLILDEATSSLDTTTENALLSAAHKAFQGRTILTIAHRLSTILDYDRIIVLENGKIVEDGSPYELQRKSDGIFNMLLNSGRSMSAMPTLLAN